MFFGTNSWKLKADQKFFGWTWSKWGLFFRSWNSKICFILRINGWIELIFFTSWYKLMKPNSYFNNFCVGMIKNGCVLLGNVILKSAIYQEWINELSWFCSCWNIFMKAKSYSNNFWPGLVKNVCVHLGHATAKFIWSEF